MKSNKNQSHTTEYGNETENKQHNGKTHVPKAFPFLQLRTSDKLEIHVWPARRLPGFGAECGEHENCHKEQVPHGRTNSTGLAENLHVHLKANCSLWHLPVEMRLCSGCSRLETSNDSRIWHFTCLEAASDKPLNDGTRTNQTRALLGPRTQQTSW